MAGNKLSRSARQEMLTALRDRYGRASKIEKGAILDEFVALSGYNRKYATRILGNAASSAPAPRPKSDNRIYGEAVKESLIVLWEASDRICSKRLQAILPNLIESLEGHGHLQLDPDLKNKLLSISPASIDRTLKPVRKTAGSRRRHPRRRNRHHKMVPIRTFADWHGPKPGYLEIDLVAHCGGNMAGSFIQSLAVTDVASGWVEAVPLLAREQTLVTEALGVIGSRLPVPILGIDSDNDSAFISQTLIDYCQEREIEFTRSRPYRSNDQAYIEQKNGAVVRHFAGYERFAGLIAGQTLARLFAFVGLYTNFFQPSFKLISKERYGARTQKRYDRPQTPCQRLIDHPAVAEKIKEGLRASGSKLDPLFLLSEIRAAQSALATLAAPEERSKVQKDDLTKFLSKLSHLWREGEANPTRRRKRKPHWWRTRKDPLEHVWPQVLTYLQDHPDASGTQILKVLMRDHPDSVGSKQLRTLQRRLKQWRSVMAKELVYGVVNGADGAVENAEIVRVIAPIGAK